MDPARLQSQLSELRDQVALLLEENKILRQKLDALARRFFGTKRDVKQLTPLKWKAARGGSLQYAAA